jgi:hypothetical protein
MEARDANAESEGALAEHPAPERPCRRRAPACPASSSIAAPCPPRRSWASPACSPATIATRSSTCTGCFASCAPGVRSSWSGTMPSTWSIPFSSSPPSSSATAACPASWATRAGSACRCCERCRPATASSPPAAWRKRGGRSRTTASSCSFPEASRRPRSAPTAPALPAQMGEPPRVPSPRARARCGDRVRRGSRERRDVLSVAASHPDTIVRMADAGDGHATAARTSVSGARSTSCPASSPCRCR